MEALSLFEMIWQLGVMCAVATPIVIIIGGVIFLLWKPIDKLDQL